MGTTLPRESFHTRWERILQLQFSLKGWWVSKLVSCAKRGPGQAETVILCAGVLEWDLQSGKFSNCSFQGMDFAQASSSQEASASPRKLISHSQNVLSGNCWEQNLMPGSRYRLLLTSWFSCSGPVRLSTLPASSPELSWWCALGQDFACTELSTTETRPMRKRSLNVDYPKNESKTSRYYYLTIGRLWRVRQVASADLLKTG